MMDLRQSVIRAFNQEFGSNPLYITRSPGRVNIIGEHTDYNDGFVLPMAIDYHAWVALRPRSDKRVIITALDKDQKLDFGLDGFSKGKVRWQEYIKGVAWALQHDVVSWIKKVQNIPFKA